MISGNIDLLGFLALGFLGGFAHCVPMCAPFVMLVSRQHSRPVHPRAPFAAQLWYTVGRTMTYSALGAMAGALGSVIALAGTLVGLQRSAAVFAGLVLVAGSVAAMVNLGPRIQPCGTWFGRVVGLLKGRVPRHPIAMGLVLGLLPCGLLYTAIIAAVGRGGALQGAIALAVFGLGTSPALLGISIADALLAPRRSALDRVAHAFMLLMGVWYLWKGIGT